MKKYHYILSPLNDGYINKKFGSELNGWLATNFPEDYDSMLFILKDKKTAIISLMKDKKFGQKMRDEIKTYIERRGYRLWEIEEHLS